MASKSKPPTSGGQPKRRLSDQIPEENLEAIDLFSVDSSPKLFSSTSFILHDFCSYTLIRGLPRWLSGKELACQCRSHRRLGFDP